MTNPEPKVAIIILNWNGIQDTLAVLDNLASVNYSNFSVLVVDNASTDDSIGQLARYIEKHRQRKAAYDLALLPLSQNFGYAEGNNKGIQQASRQRPDYYLLLNNDTVLSKDFLKRLVSVAEKSPRVIAAAPLIYYADQAGKKLDKVWFAGGWLNFYAGGAHHLTEIKEENRVKEWFPTEFLTGCCLLVKKEGIRGQSQLFDPAFFAYCEDVDLSCRWLSQGRALALVPEAIIWHKLAASSGGPKSANFWYYNVRNNFLILARYAQWYHRFVFWLYFIFYKPVLLSVIGRIIRPRPDKQLRLVAIAEGTWDALRHYFGKRGETKLYPIAPKS